MAAAYAQLAGSLVSILIVTIFSSRTFTLPIDKRAGMAAVIGVIASCVISTFVQPPVRIIIDLLFNIAVFLLLSIIVLLLSGFQAQLREDVTGLLQKRFRRNPVRV